MSQRSHNNVIIRTMTANVWYDDNDVTVKHTTEHWLKMKRKAVDTTLQYSGYHIRTGLQKRPSCTGTVTYL